MLTVEILRDRVSQGKIYEYLPFYGHQETDDLITTACLSQWYPVSFTFNGDEYKTAEHFMMAAKARLFSDRAMLQKILACNHPRDAQKYGKQVQGYNDAIWDGSRFKVVVQGNLLKFSQNPELAGFLLSTDGKILVEASPVDRVWGVGLRITDPRVYNPLQWQGRNLLGFALMAARKKLRNEFEYK